MMKENSVKSDVIDRTEYEKKLRSKVYVRCDDGAKLYSMSKNSFIKLARDAGAIYKINKMVLVNTKYLDEYLETFRL